MNKRCLSKSPGWNALRVIFMISGFMTGPNPVNAYTCSTKKVKCPVDHATVEFCVTMSMTTFGSYYDFQKKGAIGAHYEQLINSCPKCHYSGYLADFDTVFSEQRRGEILEFLSKYDGLNIDNFLECKIAGTLKNFMGKGSEEIANCFLVGSYLLRSDTSKVKLRKEYQLMVSKYLLKAIENHEIKDSSAFASVYYLIAEMYRRTAKFARATIYYDKAINDPNKQEWVMAVATRQKELAMARDDDNEI